MPLRAVEPPYYTGEIAFFSRESLCFTGEIACLLFSKGHLSFPKACLVFPKAYLAFPPQRDPFGKRTLTFSGGIWEHSCANPKESFGQGIPFPKASLLGRSPSYLWGNSKLNTLNSKLNKPLSFISLLLVFKNLISKTIKWFAKDLLVEKGREK